MNKRILVVDDDAPIRNMVCRILQLGHEDLVLEQAEDGKVALAILENQDFDLLILDFMMPVMGGLEVLEEIREKGLSLPIIMLTARADESHVLQTLEMGANYFVRKPFEPKELLTLAGQILEIEMNA